MAEFLSRENLEPRHFEHRHSHNAHRFEGWQYRVEIILELSPIRQAPGPASVTIKSFKDDQAPSHTIVPGTKDRRRFSELVFLLAAKLKYDILLKHPFDHAGFLHSKEIIRLNQRGVTKVQPTLYGAMGHLHGKASQPHSPENVFLRKFFIERDQLWHFVCFCGTTNGYANSQDLVWWLNISPEDIFFRDTSGHPINDSRLKEMLAKLFPPECLLEVPELQAFMKRLEGRFETEFRRSEESVAREATPTMRFDTTEEFEHKLREILKNEALQHLCEKLKPKDENDYQPLDLDCGIPEEYEHQLQGEEVGVRETKLNLRRKWKHFNFIALLKPFGIYVLSSDVGTGKTTFLRHLQLQLLKKEGFVPIFIHASKIEKCEPGNVAELVQHLAKGFYPKLREGEFVSYLLHALSQKKVFLLIDGMDQIHGVGTEYDQLIDKIMKLFPDNLIIASRPTAVISLEENKDVTFLRLKPFSAETRRRYFREHYKRACDLSMKAPDLVAVPMLAYMVRSLIDKKLDRNIKNRAQLYQRFVSHILSGYEHEEVKLSRHMAAGTRSILGQISYDALAEKTPLIQKIPADFCWERIESTGAKLDDLPKYGLVNLIVERSEGAKDFLYFTHQSFQEFLAAEWAARSRDKVNHILDEIWNPKWKEVIKFLAGLIGTSFVEQIYSTGFEDDIIHSRLFLTAACCAEVGKSSPVERDLLAELKELIRKPPFETDALIALSKLNTSKAADFFLELLFDKQLELQDHQFKMSLGYERELDLSSVLTTMKRKFTDQHKDIIISFLETCQWPLCEELAMVIGYVSNSLKSKDIDALIDYVCTGGIYDVLCFDASKRLSSSHVERIFRYIRGGNTYTREQALKVLEELTCHFYKFKFPLTRKSHRLINFDYTDEEVISFGIHKKIQPKHIEILTKCMMRKTQRWDPAYTQARAFSVLSNLAGKIPLPSSTIAAVVNLLKSPSSHLLETVLDGIGRFVSQIQSIHINQIKSFIKDSDINLQKTAIYAFSRLVNKLSDEDISIVMPFLQSDNAYLKYATLYLLKRAHRRLSDSQINAIVRLLPIETEEDFSISDIIQRRELPCCCSICNFDLLESVCQLLRVLTYKMLPQHVDRIIEAIVKDNKLFLDVVIRNPSAEDFQIQRRFIPLPPKLTRHQFGKVLGLLKRGSTNDIKTALIFLYNVNQNLNQDCIRRIVPFVESSCVEVVRLAILTLKKCKQLSSSQVDTVIKCLDHEDRDVRFATNQYLNRHATRLTQDNVMSLLGMLQCGRTAAKWISLEVLENIVDKVQDSHVHLVVDALTNPNTDINSSAVTVLKKLADKLTFEDIQKIERYACGQDKFARLPAIEMLLFLNDTVSSEQIYKLIDCLVGPYKDYSAYSVCELIDKVASMLDDRHVHRIMQIYKKSLHDQAVCRAVSLLPKMSLLKYEGIFRSLLDKSDIVQLSDLFKILNKIAGELEPQSIWKIIKIMPSLEDNSNPIQDKAYFLLKNIYEHGNFPDHHRQLLLPFDRKNS